MDPEGGSVFSRDKPPSGLYNSKWLALSTCIWMKLVRLRELNTYRCNSNKQEVQDGVGSMGGIGEGEEMVKMI